MYNPLASYEDNLRNGPSPEWNRGGSFPKIRYTSEPRFSCLGFPLHLPLGIPAGPLLSSSYVNVALDAGFVMPVYKTVRSSAWESHPWPNVLRVDHFMDKNPQNSRPLAQVLPLQKVILDDESQRRALSITNAFGVPSQTPEIWKKDVQSISKNSLHDGYMPTLSFQGSRREGRSWLDFLDDTALCAQLAANAMQEIGGRCLEMNVSCPNEAGAPIYTDKVALEDTLRAAAFGLRDFPNLKLIIKMGIIPETDSLSVVELVAKYAHGIAAINTLSAIIETPDGKRALGSKAEHGGICGDVIRTVALETIKKLHTARESLGLVSSQFALIGVGGCSSFTHLQRFLEAGADVVHAATGAMWNLQLASECALELGVAFTNEDID